ncbi:MAG: beta-ketoacyl-ACP reductase [Alphaproteobacteria bacterium]|nr:beta-ketoacyl-ACP reductase [Alphaproteobacteria bacterium]
MFDLTGRGALVTGASGGIGGEIVRALHRAGAAVALSGTRTAALEAVRADLGERAHVVSADLSDAAAPDQLVKEADELLCADGAGLDILVNNAGFARDNLAMRMKDEEWQQVIELNLTAGFRLIRSALRLMMKRRFGRIIGISSVVASKGNPGQVNYTASKAGMEGLTKSLATEVATRGITVNCVAPGMIKTPMTDELTDAVRDRMILQIPAGRLGLPEEVAAVCVFLAAPEASYVTGQTLHVNGGMFMS